MARCDEGYLCAVCGADVAEITESELYLAFVLGEVGVEELLKRPDRHIPCAAERAQYVVDPAFPAVRCEGFFDKATLDPMYVTAEEARVTRGWRRLQEVVRLGVPIGEYPLR
ncbi:MAG: hypothetical protein ACRC33_21775 [Gemmataceae bacterium]